MLTIGLCVVYYSLIEKIPLEMRLNQNDTSIIYFVIWVHFMSCFKVDFEPVYMKKLHSESRLEYICRIGYVVVGYFNFALAAAICLVWPALAWFNFGLTKVDTDYYALRYVFYFLYIVIQNVPYGAIDNMQMLLGDGILLTQIFAMLSYNRTSLSLVVFVMVPLILFQNGKICIDVVLYEKEETFKSSFVRLLGPHDSIYLMIVFTILIMVMTVLDAIAVDVVHLFNFLYVFLVVYLFTAIMDTKQSKLANSCFPAIAIFGSTLAIYLYLLTQVIAKQDSPAPVLTQPLYVPYLPVYGPQEETPQLTYMQAIWSRMNLKGLWFWLDYFFYPFLDWIFYPFFRFTIWPVLAWIGNGISWFFSFFRFWSPAEEVVEVIDAA